MKECPVCRRCYPDQVDHCPEDREVTTLTLPGEQLIDGRYLLERRLGQGGMGLVFQARHIFLKTVHAIKIILPDLVGNDPMLVTRFRQEALAAAAIRHQNIIAVTDFGVVRGTMPFLVMEFVNGRSLQDILAEEKVMSPARALEFMSAMGAAVAAAHRQNIVHRDLKPLNVMTQEKLPIAEGLKILDFGLAKIKSGELLGSFVQAKTSGLMGSPFYMAPEQWSDDEPDSRADIYSLGIILYQMLSGDVPFKGSSIPAIMKKHLTLPPPSFQSIGVNVPPNVEAVVRHALEKEAAARTPTVDALVQEFRNAVNSGGATIQSIRETGSFDPNRTVLSPAPTSTDPVIGEKTGHTEAAFDSMAGTISAGALGDEARKALASEEYQRGQAAHDKVARDELAREAEARRTYDDETTRKQRQEEERLRKGKEEQEERDRQQREQLDRVAQQARELEGRLARLATSIPPTPGLIDPEARQVSNGFPAMVPQRPRIEWAAAPAKRKSQIAAIGIAAVTAIPMLVKDGIELVAERVKKSRTAFNEPDAGQKLSISIAHPKLLSKRFASLFLTQIYLPEMRRRVSESIKRQFVNQEPVEYVSESELEMGQEIRLKLYSVEISFSDPVTKKLDSGLNVINFIAKPNDNCHPGTQLVLLSISDAKTHVEYESMSFFVQVRDYAFDHISRPLLSKAVSGAIGIGSLAMFTLTLLGKIDTTLGLTSGTVAGTFASGIYLRFFSLYQQSRTANIPLR